MEKELQELDRRLFDRRRHDGTACVLIHGQPGGGKSHLARQYVNKNRKKFSGGVFWIVSHLKEERDQAFESIYQKAVARESPGNTTRINKGGQSFVESVKAWFESRHEWLIVFDGVTSETDNDLTEWAKFVPDSQNSSLIYISRQRNLDSKQRLLRPHAIRIQALKADDARKLLFKELQIKKPTEEEIEHGLKLVKQVDCLPLAIDAISHRIADTHEPLLRYSVKSFSSNHKLAVTYNQILDDIQRLGHMEAWNLINVLAFYGQHVPVEMLHLGVKGLEHVGFKSTDGIGQPDLNVTFGILMRHDTDTSSSRDSLVEPEPIDMLKIVVQSFCRDSLDSRNMLPEWLQHAAQLLHHSYTAADFKIKQKDQPARVSDYRYYLVRLRLWPTTPQAFTHIAQVHCRRLYEHAQHYENKKQSLAPIRADLEPLLETLTHQISMLEPGSSQESVDKICQASIFDRTTSSSDSVPSAPSVNEVRTPPHRLSLLPLAHETLWGTDARKPSLESPASIGSTRTPRIVDHSPYQSLYDDFGYESDREAPRYTSQPMRKNLSEATERPPAHSKENVEDGWQVVSSNRRMRQPRIGRDLGSFRPTPARATRAEVNRGSATGTVGRSSERTQNRSSEAKMALSEVHSRSPPPTRRGLPSSATSFWQRIPLAGATNSQRTWASVAAGQDHRPKVQPIPHTQVPDIIPTSASPERAMNRQRNQFSSPLASEIHHDQAGNGCVISNRPYPSHQSSHQVSPQMQPAAPYYTTPPESSRSQSQPRYVSAGNFYQSPPVVGPNPSQLPYDTIDDDFTLSSKRRLPEDLRNENIQPIPYPMSTPHSQRSQSSRASLYPPYGAYYPVSALPAGYTSQPMSRDTSNQSRISAAETEPPHFAPPFNPRPGSGYTVEPPSPRDRLPDGRPLRKSPRSEHAFPTHSSRTSLHDLSQSLPGVGDWVYHEETNAGPMSRSSSGPGVAIEDDYGHGLGIVQFDGHLRFGEQVPIIVEEARQRALELEARLAAQRMASSGREQRGRAVLYPFQGAVRGYPEVNLIPTQAIRAIVGESKRR
ncbi:MAG: hypothetical protein Q9185_003998 [Variospora sp. 1 TL-2023]